jgi:molecular chaperone DnaK
MADSLAYTAEKTLRDNAERIPADLKERVEARIKDVRDALAGADGDAIRSAAEALSTSMQEIGQAVYGGASGAPSGDGAAEGQGESAGTVEGEFREV